MTLTNKYTWVTIEQTWETLQVDVIWDVTLCSVCVLKPQISHWEV